MLPLAFINAENLVVSNIVCIFANVNKKQVRNHLKVISIMEKSVKNNKNVKVAYNVYSISKDGFTYDQRITIHLTKEDIDNFGDYVLDKVALGEKPNYVDRLYLKRIGKGDNYTNNTTLKHFIKFFNLEDNKRIKRNRNTIIRVIN